MIQRRNSDLDIEERFARESNRLQEKNLGKIAKAYRELVQGIGEDLDREGLRHTPDRAARALEFLTQGYRQDLGEIINDAVFDSEASEIILLRTSSFILCANIICFPSSDGRTSLTFRMGK